MTLSAVSASRDNFTNSSFASLLSGKRSTKPSAVRLERPDLKASGDHPASKAKGERG